MASNHTIEIKAKTGGMTGGASAKTGNAGLTNAMSARQSAIARQKQLDDKGVKGNEKSVESMRSLVRSVNALTKEIKTLEMTIKNKNFGGGSGGGEGGMNVGKGMMSAGSAIPFAGAALAVTGFIAAKVAEIGNAYIEKVGEQAKTVGVAGMHRGAGMYMATEMSAGMKSYAMATGRFSHNVNPDDERTALQVGAIYGQSADEAMGTAGKFKRAGADERDAVVTMMGGGIETQLPTLLAKMADEMEEAVKNGFNAADMAKTMPDLLTKMTMANQTKDVNLAIKTARGATGSKDAASKGQIEDMGSFMDWRTGQERAIEKFNDDKFIDKEVEAGNLDASHKARLAKMKAENGGVLDRRSVESALGASVANTYYRSTINGMSEAELQVGKAKQLKHLVDPKGTRSAADLRAAMQMTAPSLGLDLGGMGGIDALLRMLDGKSKINPDKGAGAKALDDANKRVKESTAAYGVKNGQARENFQFDNAKPMADATLAVEKGMRDLAQGGINTLSKAMDLLSGKITATAKEVDEYKKKVSKMSTAEYIKYAAQHPLLDAQAGIERIGNLFSGGKK